MLSLAKLEAFQESKVQELRLKANELNIYGLIFTIIGAMLAIVIGASLITTVADQAVQAQSSANVTGAASTLIGLLTLLFVVLIMFVAIGAYKLVT